MSNRKKNRDEPGEVYNKHKIKRIRNLDKTPEVNNITDILKMAKSLKYYKNIDNTMLVNLHLQTSFL